MLIGAPGQAETESNHFSCWDNSFAYTAAGLRQIGEHAEFRISTQDRRLLLPLTRGDGDWGPVVLSIKFAATACTADRGQRAFRCRGDVVSTDVTFTNAVRERTGHRRINAKWAETTFIVTDGSALSAKDHEGIYRALTIRLRDNDGAMTSIGPYHWNADCSGWPDPFRED